MAFKSLLLFLFILLQAGCGGGGGGGGGSAKIDCGTSSSITSADLNPALNSFSGCSAVPREELLLITPDGDNQCLGATGSTISQAACDVYEASQWWARHASADQVIHFSSGKCLTRNSDGSFNLVTCAGSTTIDINNVCGNSATGNFFHNLEAPVFSYGTFACDGENNYLKFDQISVTSSNNGGVNILDVSLSSSLSSHTLSASIDNSSTATILTDLNLRQGQKVLCNIENENIILEEVVENGRVGMKAPQNINCGTQKNLDLSIGVRHISGADPPGSSVLFSSATTTVNNTEATLSGYFESSTGPLLLNFILQNPNVDTLIFSNLPGSSDDEGLAYYAPFVRAVGFNTRLPATGVAESGGVDLFLAGVTRTVEKGGVLGVHSWAGGSSSGWAIRNDRNNPLHQSYITYANNMLGSPEGENFYFFTLNGGDATDGTEFCNMTTDQMLHFNVATSVVDSSPLVPPGQYAINNQMQPTPFCLHFFSFTSLTSSGAATSSTSPTFNWTVQTYTPFVLDEYQVAIGTTAGGDNVLTWTDLANTMTSYQATSLSLTPSTDYFFSVRAISTNGTGDELITSAAWQYTP